MRTKTVKVAEKNIVIMEKTIGELKQLSKDINVDLNNLFNTELKEMKTDEVVTSIFTLVEAKLTTIFPQLTEADIENAYMSQLEELIEGFIDVNFSGMKKVFSKVMTMM